MQGLFAYFAGFGVWNWFILAVLLFVLEFMLPGVHFLWFGLAAVIVGILALATGMSWQFQVIAFGIIAVLTVFWVRRYVRSDAAKSDLPDLNERGQQYIGRSLVVEQAIQNGRGKVRVGDYGVAGRGARRAGGRARESHRRQGHRAGGGACNGLTASRARCVARRPRQHGLAVDRRRARAGRRLRAQPRGSGGRVVAGRGRRAADRSMWLSISSGRTPPSPRAINPN